MELLRWEVELPPAHSHAEREGPSRLTPSPHPHPWPPWGVPDVGAPLRFQHLLCRSWILPAAPVTPVLLPLCPPEARIRDFSMRRARLVRRLSPAPCLLQGLALSRCSVHTYRMDQWPHLGKCKTSGLAKGEGCVGSEGWRGGGSHRRIMIMVRILKFQESPSGRGGDWARGRRPVLQAVTKVLSTYLPNGPPRHTAPLATLPPL